MIEFASVVLSFNPWYIVSVAIVLIALDIFLINTETLLWLALALFIVAGGNAYDLPPVIQLWSYPVSLIGVLVAQRLIGQILYRTPDPYRDLETYVGQTGRLRVKKSVTDNAQYFRSDPSRAVLESKTDGEKSEAQDTITIVKIELSDGKILPAIIDDGSEPSDGAVVEVSGVQGQQLRVRR